MYAQSEAPEFRSQVEVAEGCTLYRWSRICCVRPILEAAEARASAAEAEALERLSQLGRSSEQRGTCVGFGTLQGGTGSESPALRFEALSKRHNHEFAVLQRTWTGHRANSCAFNRGFRSYLPRPPGESPGLYVQ